MGQKNLDDNNGSRYYRFHDHIVSMQGNRKDIQRKVFRRIATDNSETCSKETGINSCGQGPRRFKDTTREST